MGRTKNFDRIDVLDSAIQLFWKKGYADTSLSDLEKATGVNKSGLYSEFKDKEEIFFESLLRYHEHGVSFSLLTEEPLGWKNIENFLRSRVTCKGQKGCFMTYTLREYNIIPVKVKQLIDAKSAEVYDLFYANIKATKAKNPEILTNHVLTYASGMNLKANVQKPEQLISEMLAFLEFCKK